MASTYLSFDDTDSLDGMCTTYLAAVMVEEFSDLDLIGFPRLVRLNPNVPWKTRGNAAICLALGTGLGKPFQVGEVNGERICAFPEGRRADLDEVFSRAKRQIERHAHFSCERTNPGLVVSETRPSPSLYWSAVREIIPLSLAEKAVNAVDGTIGKFKNGRGVIGSAASMAWRPRDRTFEVIAYRSKERIGTRRDVNFESVDQMDSQFSSTFHNLDRDSGHLAIAPASPCPVLFGIRGDSPEDLLSARKKIVSEVPESWLLFLTNQATDDHLRRQRISELRPRDGVRITGTVSRAATEIPGGHVFFEITDGVETIMCAVYEPSGKMRNGARALAIGDRVEVFGSMRERPFEVNVEKMRILAYSIRKVKAENPKCPICGKHMKSAGYGAGFRCRRCGEKAPFESAGFSERVTPPLGWYEPPVCSRRHLYKPVSRFGIKRRHLREIIYSVQRMDCRGH